MVIGRFAATVVHVVLFSDAREHRSLLERGDVLAGALVDRELAFFHELQDGDAGQRLRLRGDAELRVHGHLAAGFAVGPADGALVHGLAVTQHQRHDAGDAAVVDVGVEQRVDARETLGGEPRAQRVSGLRGQRGGEGERSREQQGTGVLFEFMRVPR